MATGQPADPAEVDTAAAATSLPTLVGSGVTPANLSAFQSAEGLIVGSYVKAGHLWSNPIDERNAADIVHAFHLQ